MSRDGPRARGLTGTGAGCSFHDGNQKGEAAHKKMLKMKVAPKILLKIKGENI
jgi:hypothetical protein